MNISGIESGASTATSSIGAETQIMGKEDFLKLLLAQLQNQDPLDPTDSVEFTAQLAQFSSLEQLGNVNSNLEKLELYQASLNNSQAVSFIGKEIVAHGNGIYVSGGQPADCHFELPADAGAVTLSVYNANGEFVRTFDASNLTAGLHTIKWDAKDQNGNQVPDGTYRFEAMAESPQGEAMDVETYANGKVTGVTYSDNATYLITGQGKIPVSDVIEVSQQEDNSQQDEVIE